MATAPMRKQTQKRATDFVPPLHDFHWLLTLASFSCDKEELANLSFSDCGMIRCRVAQNYHTSADTLQLLCVDCHREVRIAVALNPHTPHPALAKLAHDPDHHVRLAVAQSLDTNIELLRELALDKDPEVSAAAKRTFRQVADRIECEDQHGHIQSYGPSLTQSATQQIV